MTFRIHPDSPADAVEAAFFRIQHERMADVPILNPVLAVEAIDFQRWKGQWLGIVLTPWCMSLLLVPGSEIGWISTGDNKRRFINFPAGDFAFLGSDEPELGEYQSCSLFSPMNKFSTQSEAVMTARASMLGLLAPPTPPEAEKTSGEPSHSRRRFLALGKRTGR
ncbi:[NiFe]-hydrogenase assembly chaperone HybE [Propionivibrio sp.]|uniref:[NiFe]-hydrogenase assembly chaperone HybE n=1 Tax=Propionivibrio sp. TaxID=2212460 RepID=UPI003BF40885